MKTVRLTMGQALVKFLDNQFISLYGEEDKFVHGVSQQSDLTNRITAAELWF